MGINRPVFGPIGAVLVVFGNLGRPVGLPGPQPWELSHFSRKTTVSRAGRPESGFRGHFSGVPPPGFGGFHTLLRPQSASSTPYRLPGRGRKGGRKEGLYRAPHRVPSRHVNNNNNLRNVYNNKIIIWSGQNSVVNEAHSINRSVEAHILSY